MKGGGLGPYDPGEWSDDTQMTLCVAQVAAQGGDLTSPEALDQVAEAFTSWLAGGATDVGTQTRAVLTEAERPARPSARAPVAGQRGPARPHGPHGRQRRPHAHLDRRARRRARPAGDGPGRARRRRAHARRPPGRRLVGAVVRGHPAGRDRGTPRPRSRARPRHPDVCRPVGRLDRGGDRCRSGAVPQQRLHRDRAAGRVGGDHLDRPRRRLRHAPPARPAGGRAGGARHRHGGRHRRVRCSGPATAPRRCPPSGAAWSTAGPGCAPTTSSSSPSRRMPVGGVTASGRRWRR